MFGQMFLTLLALGRSKSADDAKRNLHHCSARRVVRIFYAGLIILCLCFDVAVHFYSFLGQPSHKLLFAQLNAWLNITIYPMFLLTFLYVLYNRLTINECFKVVLYATREYHAKIRKGSWLWLGVAVVSFLAGIVWPLLILGQLNDVSEEEYCRTTYTCAFVNGTWIPGVQGRSAFLVFDSLIIAIAHGSVETVIFWLVIPITLTFWQMGAQIR